MFDMKLIPFVIYVITIYGCNGCRLEIKAEHGNKTSQPSFKWSHSTNKYSKRQKYLPIRSYKHYM